MLCSAQQDAGSAGLKQIDTDSNGYFSYEDQHQNQAHLNHSSCATYCL